MSHRMTARAATAALALALGLGTVAAAVSAGAALGSSTVECTKYVVTAQEAVEVWAQPDPAAPYESWNKWPRGHVFCSYGSNTSLTRLQVRYSCHPAENCNPATRTGWVTADPLSVTPIRRPSPDTREGGPRRAGPL